MLNDEERDVDKALSLSLDNIGVIAVERVLLFQLTSCPTPPTCVPKGQWMAQEDTDNGGSSKTSSADDALTWSLSLIQE